MKAHLIRILPILAVLGAISISSYATPDTHSPTQIANMDAYYMCLLRCARDAGRTNTTDIHCVAKCSHLKAAPVIKLPWEIGEIDGQFNTCVAEQNGTEKCAQDALRDLSEAAQQTQDRADHPIVQEAEAVQ